MFASLIAATLLAGVTPELSPEAQRAVAPVLDAIAAERTAQARLPPPRDDVEKLLRLARLDQAPRTAFRYIDLSKAPPAERAAAGDALTKAVKDLDRANEAELLKLVPHEGWFARSKYGEDGERSAFLVIQHSSVEIWRRFLPVIRNFVAKGEASGESYALMFDRLATTEGRPQRYGSQFRCQSGKLVAYPLEDPARVDAFRKEAGLRLTYAEQAERLAATTAC